MNEESLSIEANVRLARGDDPTVIQRWLSTEYGAAPSTSRRVVKRLVSQRALRARGLGLREAVKGALIGAVTAIGWMFNESLAEVWPVIVDEKVFFAGGVFALYYLGRGATAIASGARLED